MDRRGKLEYIAGKKIFSVWDVAVVLLILAVAAGVFFVAPKKAGGAAEVYSDGRLVARLPLNINTELTVARGEGYNAIRIADGRVYVYHASCGDRNCIAFGRKYRAGEQIVCLPNRLVIKIVGKKGEGLDGVVG